MDSRINSFSPSIITSFRNLFILGDINCHHPLWDSKGTSDPPEEEVFDWMIFSDLLSFNDPDTPTLLNRSFPHILFAPSPLALSCSQKVLQDLGSDHQPILQAVVFSPVFRPNKPSPSFNSQKARWDDFTFYFDSHSFSAEEYSSLSLSSPAALFTSLTLNVVKFSIPFGRIKRCSKAWWSAEAEEAVIERRKAFAAAHRSDKIDRLTSPLPDVLRLSSPKLRNGRQLALFSRLNLTLNLCTLPFVLSLAHLPPLLTSQTVPLPGSVFGLFQCSVLLKEFIVSEIYLKPLPP